jgi:hypothetical protein
MKRRPQNLLPERQRAGYDLELISKVCGVEFNGFFIVEVIGISMPITSPAVELCTVQILVAKFSELEWFSS